MLLLTLAAAPKAQAQMRRDALGSIGAGQKLVWGSAGYRLTWSLPFAKNLSLGTGLRTTVVHSGNRTFYQHQPEESTGEKLSLNADPTLHANLAVILSAEYRVVPKLAVGFNIDLVGGTVGPSAMAQPMRGPGPLARTTIRPDNLSLLGGGWRDQGLLNSEFYLAYQAGKVWIKAGFAHQHLDVYLVESSAIAPNHFDEFVNSGFVGVIVPLGKGRE